YDPDNLRLYAPHRNLLPFRIFQPHHVDGRNIKYHLFPVQVHLIGKRATLQHLQSQQFDQSIIHIQAVEFYATDSILTLPVDASTPAVSSHQITVYARRGYNPRESSHLGKESADIGAQPPFVREADDILFVITQVLLLYEFNLF